MRPKRHSLAIELTGYCNQKCGYCYNDWRGDKKESHALPTEALLDLIERAVADVEWDHVTLTGGEPFARADFFTILGRLASHGLRAIIISNGGLVTNEHAERLAPFRPHFVQITLNGPTAELHEEHVGKGHFEPTLAGIRALVGKNVKVSGCIVVTRKNASKVASILELFLSLGVEDIALSRYSPAGYASEQVADLLPSRSELLSALAAAEPFARDRGMTVQVTMPVPPCVVDTSRFPHIRFSSCPIGTDGQEFALGTDGKLRNCTLHTDVVAHTDQGESFAAAVTSEAVARYRDVTPAFCAPCPMRASCLGGCGAASQSVFTERGLDPFVAQHVDEAFAAGLKSARAAKESFVPVGRLSRRGVAGLAGGTGAPSTTRRT